MLSETLTNELHRYAVGPRIKALRLRKKLGLVQLSAHTGLSSAMLSKIERGQMFPTLPTLVRIAMVFGVGLDYFFTADRQPLIAVVRKEQRLRLPTPPGEKQPAYLFESLDYPVADRRMEAFYAEFPSDSAPSEAHQHGNAEFIFVLDGHLTVSVDGKETTLDIGDAMYFDSTLLHSYRREGAKVCTAIVVTAP